MLIVQFVRSAKTYMYARGLSTASKLAMVWGSNPNGYCVPIVQSILILMLYVDKARPRLMSPVAYALINPTFKTCVPIGKSSFFNPISTHPPSPPPFLF